VVRTKAMGERGRDIFLKFGPQNFDNVVFCAPPSGNEDYTQEVSASGARVAESGERRRLEVPRGEGGRVAKRRLIGVHGCSRGDFSPGRAGGGGGLAAAGRGRVPPRGLGAAGPVPPQAGRSRARGGPHARPRQLDGVRRAGTV